ncbi:MAG: hypothetical protein H7323_00250 [Frankiales bacterium]|nr:hypothetical protein [Frankiales bacterium]
MTRTQRGLRVLAAGLLTLSVATLGLTGVNPQRAAAADSTAVTVTGSPGFPGLAVTVSKTRGLVNEVTQISWTGSRPTRGNFGVDYLQIMQCWGDAATGPEREQCQFGGLTGDLRGGAFVSSRQVSYDLTDPLETYRRQSNGPLRFVPFRSVTGKTKEAGLSEFYDASTTNEVPYARSRPDGGGTLPFEVQTSTEAPGLGCGVARAATSPAGSDTATATVATGPAGTPGLRCWLVVVPRGDREVDGSLRTAEASRQLLSSPLSQSNWQQRLVVPLDFTQVGQPCPLGKAERAVVGHEDVTEAISSWQPTLCAGNGPVYSYSQLADNLARRQAVGDAPSLSVTTRPVPAAEAPAGRTPTYAPIALSGLSVAFNIDSQSAFSAPPEVKARDGQQLTELNLTPRLVAKLLTQSYRVAAAQDRTGLENNPLDLTRDPDFRRLNPTFTQLSFTGIGGIVVPAGLSDSAGLVWEWLLADAEAKAFIAGAPDPDGMVINPSYKGAGQQDGFPKSDSVCTTFQTTQPPLCTLDAFPYAGDLHEASRAAARGDTLSRSTFDPSAVPAVYRRSLPQPTGSRAVLALADTATAARFGLQTAKLRNTSGAFVAPDDTGLLAALAAMPASEVPGVLRPDPATAAAAAYPLASVSYAFTTPTALDAPARLEYAAFLRYAAGPGQQRKVGFGGLPVGYAPLPQAQRAQTLAAAGRIATTRTPASAVAPTSAATGTVVTTPDSGGLAVAPPFDSGTSPDTAAGLTAFPAPVSQPLGASPVVAGGPAPVRPEIAPNSVPAVLVVGSPTPIDDPGAARYGVVLVLATGGLAALAGSWLRRPRRLSPRAVTP